MRIAGVQMDVALGDVALNLERIRIAAEETARNGAQLVVFPECAITGYCFDSKAAAMTAASKVPGNHAAAIQEIAADCGLFIVCGTLERAEDELFNVALCVGPEGLVGAYRKTHLPHLGVDHFVTHGDNPYSVVDIGGLKLGMLICYDASFPEASRALALQGADLIVLPTNWPPGAEQTADYVINARASENKVYYQSVNRIGTEAGFQFIGKSKICDVHGNTLTFADHHDPAIMYADIDPGQARHKRIERAVGHWVDRLADRRPDLYARVVEPITGSDARSELDQARHETA